MNQNKFYLCAWASTGKEDPLWIASEVNDVLSVIRQIEFHPPTKIIRKSVTGEANSSLVEIDFDLGFFDETNLEVAMFEITQKSFEQYWNLSIKKA